MATIQIPLDEDAEDWLNTVRRTREDAGNVDPKARSRSIQERQETPTSTRRTTTSPISGASAEQLALTLLAPSDGRQR